MGSNRIVVLVDMDCFYVQVEQRRDPEYKGKPCAVVQYKKYRGGGIIAVGYEARACGVTRGMMGNDAMKLCPDIHLFRVPESNGKANLDRYRQAGAEVINVLSQFGGRVERASIDEAYIDLTDLTDKIISEENEQDYLRQEKLASTHIVGFPASHEEGEEKETVRRKAVSEWLEKVNANKTNLRLSIAAVIVEEIRAAVYQQTGFRCSAGISHNKMLSKLACGINKPNKQTLLPQVSICDLFRTIKIGKIRNLGGKLGKSLISDFDVEFIGQIADINLERLVAKYGVKTANWMKEVCQGIDHELVKERHVAQSIGCGKNFFGPDALNTKTKVKKWMDSLMIELSERLQKDKESNNRIAKTLTVHLKLDTGKSYSRSGPLMKYDRVALIEQSMQLIRSFDSRSSNDERWQPAIIQLSVNAKKFDNVGGPRTSTPSKREVSSFFKPTQSSVNVIHGDNLESPALDTMQPSQHQISLREKKEDSESVEKEPKCRRPSLKFENNSGDFSNSINTGYFKTNTKVDTVDGKGFFTSRAISSASPDFCFQKRQNDSPTKQITGAKGIAMGNMKSAKILAGSFDSVSNLSGAAMFEPDNCKDPSDNRGSFKDEDVIFVSESTSIPRSETKSNVSAKNRNLCKIDQMFLKEKEKPVKIFQSNSSISGSLVHPNFEEIDKDVFNDLPKDIQQEIMRANKKRLSSPYKGNSSQNTSKVKSPNKGQRLISNFIPQSQNSENSSPRIISKRKSTSPSIQNKSKLKKSKPAAKSPPVFASSSMTNVMPLGFFRQRSQLSSAIAKAISNDRRPFIRHVP